jgi:hypothetical protein
MSKLKWILPSIFLTLLLVLIIIPWNDIVEDIAKEQINKQGFGPTQLHISSFGFSGTTIQDLSVLNGGVKVKTIEVDWSVAGLLSKQIKDLRISGVDVDPTKLSQSKKIGEEKSNILDFEAILQKFPTEKVSLDLLLPESFSNFKLERKKIILDFDKRNALLEILLKEPLKVQQDVIDLTIKPFKLAIKIEKHKLFVSFQKLSVDLKYFFDVQKKQFVQFDKVEISDKSFMTVLSTSEGFRPGSLELELNSVRGAYGVESANWGQINLTTRGKIDALKMQGSIKNINHVASNCLYGLDLDFSAQKSKHTTFEVQTPSSRKDLNLSIKGAIGDKVNFELRSNDLSSVNFKEMSPCVGKDISHVRGRLGINGFVGLGKKKNERVDINLKDAGFKWDQMEIEGIDIISNLTSFKTLAGATPTQIKIKKIGLAFELNDLNIDYLIKKNNIKIDQFNLSLLGGKMWADKFSLDRKTNKTEALVLQVDQIPLNDALKIGLKDAVTATGELQGRLPIGWKDEIPVVLGGKLETKSPGVLRYDPKTINPLEKAGNPNVNLLSKYLKNLNYNKLSIDVDSDEKYNLQMKANIFGTNPAVNNGRPLKFGFNLGLDIRDTIFSYMALMKIPKKLERKFLKKLQK